MQVPPHPRRIQSPQLNYPIMIDDDKPIGRVLSRREALGLLTSVGGAMFVSAGMATKAAGSGRVPPCVVVPELTEGPFFADLPLNRSDIRAEPSTGIQVPGIPLGLQFAVSVINGQACTPLAGAMVNIWQCDAIGRYSAFRDRGAGNDMQSQQFLRGYQITDEAGLAKFTTIYPGWYSGRAVHIHFKIRVGESASRTFEFTSQLFFDEDLTDRVHGQAPYAARGQRNRRNSDDGIFRRSGDQLTLALSPEGDGYSSTFGIGLDLL